MTHFQIVDIIKNNLDFLKDLGPRAETYFLNRVGGRGLQSFLIMKCVDGGEGIDFIISYDMKHFNIMKIEKK